MTASVFPLTTRTTVANLKAAVMVADHAEACGLPAPTAIHISEVTVLDPEKFVPEDRSPRIEFTMATGEDVRLWAEFLETEVQASASVNSMGRAYIHASTIGEFCEAWIRVDSCEQVAR